MVNNRFGIFYTRENISALNDSSRNGHESDTLPDDMQDESGQFIEWKVDFKLTRWPSMLC